MWRAVNLGSTCRPIGRIAPRPRIWIVSWVVGLVLLAGCQAVQPQVAGSSSPGRVSSVPLIPQLETGLTTWSGGDRPALPELFGTMVWPARPGSTGVLDLAALQGQVVVLNIWASWCQPCLVEAPELKAAAAANPAGVVFVGLNERDNEADLRSWLARQGLSYQQLLDPDGALQAKLAGLVPTAAVPSTLVIDPRGRVAARIIGLVRRDQIAAAIAGAKG